MRSMHGLAAVAAVAGLFWTVGCSQCKTCGGDCEGCPPGSTTPAAGQAGPADGGAHAAVIAQKTCPVSGEAIDPAVLTEYKGAKVYFCCDGCIAKFKKDPDTYVAKLK